MCGKCFTPYKASQNQLVCELQQLVVIATWIASWNIHSDETDKLCFWNDNEVIGIMNACAKQREIFRLCFYKWITYTETHITGAVVQHKYHSSVVFLSLRNNSSSYHSNVTKSFTSEKIIQIYVALTPNPWNIMILDYIHFIFRKIVANAFQDLCICSY